MDPVSIVGLVGSCPAIGGKVVSITAGLQQIVKAFKEADKDIARLSTQLALFSATIKECQIWLDSNKSPSPSFEKTMKAAFESCWVIVTDIEEQVQAVQPQPGESESSFSRKVKHLWNNNTIKEYERRIMNQLVAFSTVIQMVQLNGATKPGGQQKRLQTKLTEELFAKAAEDAKSVTESKSAVSRVGDYTSDNGENLSVEFSIDKEIAISKPYIRQYRRLFKAQFRNRGPQFDTISENETTRKSVSNVEVSTALTPLSPRESHGKQHSSEVSHTWNLFREETSKKAERLCSAAREGDLDQVQSLIEDLGAFIDAHNEEGDTPLICATKFGHAEVVRYLLDNGASVHLITHIQSREDSTTSRQLQDVYSPIHFAADAGFVDIMDLLTTSGANVNDARCEVAMEYGDQGDMAITKDITPLHLTAYDPECKVAIRLIDRGALVSARDSDGYTPLMIAVEKSNVRAVRIFLEAGALVDLGNIDGVTLFQIACDELSENSQECLEVLIMLIKHGADIKNWESGSPLIVKLCLQSPLSERHSEVLSLLLEAGADPNMRHAEESEKPRTLTPLACLMPERHFWSNGADHKQMVIRLKMMELLLSKGLRKSRLNGFSAISRLMYAFFNYCEDLRRWFPRVLNLATILVKLGAKFSDACPYLAKQKPFEEESRRSLFRKRILCALHIAAEHTGKNYKRPGDFMVETQEEFAQWVAGGCRNSKWPWPTIPFEPEQHFRAHRTGGLVGWLLRLKE